MTRTAPIARYLNNSSIHRTSSWGPFISWTIKIICGGLVQMWHRTIEDSKWLVHASDHQWPLTFPRLFFDCCLLPCVFFCFFLFVLYHSSLINRPFLIVLTMLFSYVKCSQKRLWWKKGHPKILMNTIIITCQIDKTMTKICTLRNASSSHCDSLPRWLPSALMQYFQY